MFKKICLSFLIVNTVIIMSCATKQIHIDSKATDQHIFYREFGRTRTIEYSDGSKKRINQNVKIGISDEYKSKIGYKNLEQLQKLTLQEIGEYKNIKCVTYKTQNGSYYISLSEKLNCDAFMQIDGNTDELESGLLKFSHDGLKKLLSGYSSKTNKSNNESKFSQTNNKSNVKNILLRKAKAGDAEAQFQLGEMYIDQGKDTEAVKWIRMAAEQNNVKAQYKLGEAYKLGKGGLSKNIGESIKWHRKAAEQGHADSQHYLALVYYVEYKNLKESNYWLVRAAENGNAEAQYLLGLRYKSTNIIESKKWLEKAAKQGIIGAQKELEQM